MSQRIGILGGTFDPVHRGHIIAAHDALRHLGLAEIVFVPCNRPSHKRAPLVSAAHRIAMLKLALKGSDCFRISDVDIKRGGVTYSVDTVRDLIREHRAGEWFFVIGSDTLPELHRWRDIDELFELCSFAVLVRPGFEPETMDRDFGLAPRRRDALLRNMIRGRCADVSSSEIRSRIAQGMCIEDLVHPNVNLYIEKRGLYR